MPHISHAYTYMYVHVGKRPAHNKRSCVLSCYTLASSTTTCTCYLYALGPTSRETRSPQNLAVTPYAGRLARPRITSHVAFLSPRVCSLFLPTRSRPIQSLRDMLSLSFASMSYVLSPQPLHTNIHPMRAPAPSMAEYRLNKCASLSKIEPIGLVHHCTLVSFPLTSLLRLAFSFLPSILQLYFGWSCERSQQSGPCQAPCRPGDHGWWPLCANL